MVFHYLADEIDRFQKAYLKLTFILSLWVVVGCYLTIDERINITIYLPIFMRHEVRICLAKCKKLIVFFEFQVENEIQTLRSVLNTKLKTAHELKRKLGFSVWKEVQDDLSQGIRNVKESNVLVFHTIIILILFFRFLGVVISRISLFFLYSVGIAFACVCLVGYLFFSNACKLIFIALRLTRASLFSFLRLYAQFDSFFVLF